MRWIVVRAIGLLQGLGWGKTLNPAASRARGVGYLFSVVVRIHNTRRRVLLFLCWKAELSPPHLLENSSMVMMVNGFTEPLWFFFTFQDFIGQRMRHR